MPDYRDPFGDGLPGPYLTLRLEWQGRTRDILAVLDTGADMTQIPGITAQGMELEQVSTTRRTTSGGETDERPVYAVDVTFEGFTFPDTWVLSDDYPIALIGRDLLAEFIACFDGPAQSFDLRRPNVATASS